MSNQSKPKLTRAEQARLNGAKSRGPKTEAGKARSSLNALKHAKYADPNLNWLPIDGGVLSNESREIAYRIFEGYCRQIQPQSEVELLLVKQLTGHQCHLERLLKVEGGLLQAHLDQVMPTLLAQSKDLVTNVPNSLCSVHAYVHCVNADDRVLRSLDRQRRSHERGIKECLRRLKELRQNFAAPIPEAFAPESFLPCFGLVACPSEAPLAESVEEPVEHSAESPADDVDPQREVAETAGEASKDSMPSRKPQPKQALSKKRTHPVDETNRLKAA